MNITLILLAIGMLPSIFATNGGNLFNIDNCWAIYGHYTFSRTIWTLMFFFQLLLKGSLECLSLLQHYLWTMRTTCTEETRWIC